MKEELTKAATEYADENGHGASYVAKDFTRGALWMLSQYNGLSPDTVKEMYEALKAIRRRSTMDGMESEEELITYLNTIKAISIPAITKAEQELKK